MVLTRLQGLFCTAHWQRVTGADKRAGRSAKQECHHTTTAWLPWWLLPCGCWLLAAGCQLCLAMVTLGLLKAEAFFPQQPGWIKLANSTVQFQIHLEVSSPVSDHQTQGVPEKTSGYWVYARSGLTTSIPSAVPASWVWRTESLKEKISSWMVWKWGSRHNAWFPPEKMLYRLTENMALFSMRLCKQGPSHHLITQISYYNWGNATKRKQSSLCYALWFASYSENQWGK